MAPSLQYKGAPHTAKSEIANGKETHLWWDVGDVGTKRRTQPIRGIVLHHTGGEGGEVHLHGILVRRKLAVHFFIDYHGKITQMADIDTVCFHARTIHPDYLGRVNYWSVGIEIQNKAVGKSSPMFPREEYISSAHGHSTSFLRFTPGQVDATRSLCRDLTQLLNLPMQLPRNAAGEVYRGLMPGKELETYQGLLGHMHFNRQKIDPSPHLFDEVLK